MTEIVQIGRVRTTPDDHWGWIEVNQIRANIFEPAEVNCWIRTVTFRGGRFGATPPVVTPLCYDGDSLVEPGELLGVFAALTLTTESSHAYNGKLETRVLVTAPGSPSSKAIKVPAGQRLAGALHSRLGRTGHNMVEAADIAVADERFHQRNGYASTTPPDPMNPNTTPSVEGWMTFWFEGVRNANPLPPIDVSPSGQIITTTPLIEATFRDPNGAYGGANDCGDRLFKCRIEVQRITTGFPVVWDHTYVVTAPEQQANRSRRLYGDGGSATPLAPGNAYRVRVAHADDFETWGPWSSWASFSVAAEGTASVFGPVGKVDDRTPDLAFTWQHQTNLATNAVQAFFFRGGALVATSDVVAMSVAAGDSDTLAWIAMGIAGALEPGVTYTARMIGRDTNDTWSEPGLGVVFTVDAAPGIPTNLSPANQVVLGNDSYPVLSCRCSDLDDTAATGLAVTAELYDNGGLVSTRAMSLRPGTTDVWDYQTTPADLATTGFYGWRASAFDGYLYNGGVEDEEDRVWSGLATFHWEDVPSVTITNPLEDATLTSETTLVEWTVADQDQFRARILEEASGEEIFSSGWIPNPVARAYTFPVAGRRHGGVYRIEIGVEADGLQGFAVVRNLTVAYEPPPAPTGLSVLAGTLPGEPFPTYAELRWDAYAGAFFDRAVIERSDLPRPLAELFSPGEAVYRDYHAPPAGPATYSVRFVERRGGGELISSDPSSGEVAIPLAGVVLVSIDQPLVDRFVWRSWNDRAWVPEGIESGFVTAGSRAEIPITGNAHWTEGEIECFLAPEIGDAGAARDVLARLARPQGRFSYRDKSPRRLFARIPAGGLEIEDRKQGRFLATIALREIGYVEGVAPTGEEG